MEYLLYILYAAFICRLISRLQFFKNSGIGIRLLIVLFIIRLMMSLVNGYLALNVLPDADTKFIYLISLDQTQMLLHDPGKFISEIFIDQFGRHHSGLFRVEDSYWNVLKLIIPVKIFGIINLITLSNFYINTLLFNFPVFLGTVAFFRFFDKLFPGKRKLLIFMLFLFPTCLYFTSVIHKDGTVFLALGFIFYYFHKIMSEKFSVKYLIGIILFLLLIFFLRNFVVMTLIPALVAWGMSIKKPKHSLTLFTVIYGMTILFFFVSESLTGFSFPQVVVNRQQSFLALAPNSNSALPTVPLQPHFISFLHQAPAAFYHVFIKPIPTDIMNIRYIPFVLEALCFEFLLLLYVFFPRKPVNRPFFFFIVFFSISMLLSIGYTIPILGAIVRYRTYYLLLLMLLMALHIQWQKIPYIKHIRIFNNM